MVPGIWTEFLHGLSPDEMVPVFAEKGWFQLELSNEMSATLLGRGDPASAGAAFRRFAEDHGVAFPQGHLWLMCDIASSDQRNVVDGLKRWLDLYLALGIRAAVLHPGGAELTGMGAQPERILEAQVGALRELAQHINGSDLTICLENMTHSAEDLCAIVEAAGCGHLGVCLDTGHLHLVQGDQGRFIRTAGRLLKALHVADNDGSQDQHLLPYARGTVDWPAVIAALNEIAYDGLFNFEIPGENRCPIPVRLVKLDYIRSILPLMLAGTA